MSSSSDRANLDGQYHTARNLQARIGLHERFSTGRPPWQAWVFAQFTLPATARLLEVGAGPGTLWRTNLERIPPGWAITLTDRSSGMIAASQHALEGAGRAFQFQLAEATNLPFADDLFDAVIANHMLYHVVERERALAEMRRVLRPGGTLYATTNGADNLRELVDMVQSFAPHLPYPAVDAPFRLENGGVQLAAYFDAVVTRRYENSLAVTEVEPIIAYLQSMTAFDFGTTITDARLDDFREMVAQRIAAEGGAFHITSASGIFLATKAVLSSSPR